ncbi:MAG: hypothetical protein RBR86_07290 [Pseudobdellovibrionaceae bacterium]|jgi:hypothetical protein|nr:hypothetical protein [Pseudobdellovibrionaceae bacterium]
MNNKTFILPSISTLAADHAEMILKERRLLDDRGLFDRPLFIVSGEDHSLPSHYVYLVALLNQLHSRDQVPSICLELDHDTLDKDFANRSGIPLDSFRLSSSCETSTLRGYFSLLSSLHPDVIESYAPLSNMMLLGYLEASNFPVSYIDVSSTNAKEIHPHMEDISFLNAQDPDTQKVLEACFPQQSRLMQSFLLCQQPEGMYVRNMHMMDKALAFAEDTHTRIVIIRVGNNHVCGNLSKNLPFNQSVAGLGSFMGHHVMAFPVVNRETPSENFPNEAHNLREKGIISFVEHLSTCRAHYGEDVQRDEAQLIHDQETEYSYLKKLLEDANLEMPRFSLDGVRKLRYSSGELLEDAYRKVCSNMLKMGFLIPKNG